MNKVADANRSAIHFLLLTIIGAFVSWFIVNKALSSIDHVQNIMEIQSENREHFVEDSNTNIPRQ